MAALADASTAASVPRILVVGAYMHQPGHYAVFPADLAAGFAANQADVTLLHPFSPALPAALPPGVRALCLETLQDQFSERMRRFWQRYQSRPLWLCLAWIALHQRDQDYSFVYWTDFPADNQQSTWPLALARWAGLYRHRTAITEHYSFSWKAHRWQRLFRLDRLRLKGIRLFVHSEPLLASIRDCTRWPSLGQYVEWGLTPTPASDQDRLSARRALGIDAHARVLLVFGMQAIRRKEIDTLAAALAMQPPTQPLTVLFAGMKIRDDPHPFDAPDILALANLNVMHYERFIPDDEIKSIFAAADAVWAYYGSFLGASGVLSQAVAHGRLPLCANQGEGGALCKKHGFGLLPPSDDLPGVSAALTEFVEMPPATQAAHERRCREAAHAMTWPAVAKKIMEAMQ